MYDANEIKRLLNQDAERFCSIFLSGGHKAGNLWRCGNINGDAPSGNGSFVVNLSGPKIGMWYENGTALNGKQAGSLIDILMYQKNLDYSAAIKEAKNWLGIRDNEKPFVSTSSVFGKVGQKSNNFISARHLIPVKEGSPAFNYLVNDRHLSFEILKKYNVCDCRRWFPNIGETDAVAFPIYVESTDGRILKNVKYLSLKRGENNKKYCTQESTGENHLFGITAISKDAEDVVICEGEIDCLTLAMLGFNALSVPMGAHADSDGKTNQANKWIENDWDFLAQFDKIRICMDNDDVGKAAALTLYSRLGIERTEIVDIPAPSKDVNECFALEGGATLKEAVENSRTIDPERFAKADRFKEKLYNRLMRKKGDLPGYPLLWDMGEYFRVRMGEISVVSGYAGHGKTTALSDLVVFLAAKHNLRACIASLEIAPEQTMQTMWSQICGLNSLRDEFGVEIPNLFEKSMLFFDDNFYFFDTTGVAKISEVLRVFEYAARRYGVKIFVLDSLMCLDVGEEDYEKQKNVFAHLTAFARRFDVHVFVVCHPKKLSEKKNPETYIPFREDISGSGHIGNLAHNVIIFWRNIGKATKLFNAQRVGNSSDIDKIQKEPDASIVIRKQREGTGALPIKNLWFESWCRQFRDHQEAKVRRYIKVNHTPVNPYANKEFF